MNVIFLSRRIYPHIGGVETHVLEISRLLVKKGHRVTIITEMLEGLRERDEVEGIEIVRLNVGKGEGFFKKFRIWLVLFSQLRFFKNADIVHCHDVFFWYLPFRFLFTNKPVYTTFHGFEGVFPVSKKAILVRKISEKLSKGNICVGKFIEKWYGTKANAIIYGGVKSVSSIKYQVLSIKKKLRILFIGRLDEDTGILEYLKVLEELKRKKLDFEFEVLGDGELKSKVQKYGKVHGFVSKPEQFISSAGIIFTSSYLSILQVLAIGKPIVAMYNNPLKKDYLNMTPFVKWMYISNNPKVVADRIVQTKSLNMKEASAWAKKQTWENVFSVYQKLWSKN